MGLHKVMKLADGELQCDCKSFWKIAVRGPQEGATSCLKTKPCTAALLPCTVTPDAHTELLACVGCEGRFAAH
jgi:hypothetical protein